MGDTAPTYSPRFDVIHLPAAEYVFGSDDIPAAVAFQIAGFHEMIHWTGNKNRLRRFKEWSRKIVTIEEIAAELGAAFLCRDLGVTPNLSPRHVAYIAPYWQDLSRDAQALARAKGIAEAAVEFIYQEARNRFRHPSRGYGLSMVHPA